MILASSPTLLIQSQADCSDSKTVFNPITRWCDAIPSGTAPPHLALAVKQDLAGRIAANLKPPASALMTVISLFQRIAWKADQLDVANLAIGLGAPTDSVMAGLQQARMTVAPFDTDAPLPIIDSRNTPLYPMPPMPKMRWLWWIAGGGLGVVLLSVLLRR